jgi:hypothetical protein
VLAYPGRADLGGSVIGVIWRLGDRGAGAGGAPVRQRGWPAARVRLVLQRETGLVGFWIFERRLLMVATAAPGGGCHRVGAGRPSRLCGQRVGLRGRHSWCWSFRAPAQILASPSPCLLRFHLSGCGRCCGWGFHGRWSLFGRKPCPTWSVPVTSTLSSAASLFGGVIVNQALHHWLRVKTHVRSVGRGSGDALASLPS